MKNNDTQFYTIIRVGDPYETPDEIIGYADSEANAQRLLQQAQVLNPYGKFDIELIKNINFLFKRP